MTTVMRKLNLDDEAKKPAKNKFFKHTFILIWKCYLQRQRRWRLLLVEAAFALLLFIAATLTAKPVFLTPFEDEPMPPLAFADILTSLGTKSILGSAPNVDPFKSVMTRVSRLLNKDIIHEATEDDLNLVLYNTSQATSKGKITKPITWVIWKPKEGNKWTYSIRSTERASYVTSLESRDPNPHLRAGFLAVQVAVNHAILEETTQQSLNYQLNLVSMPVSPLMQESRVRKALSAILLFYTLALIPPVLEILALVVTETQSTFKRAMRLRTVGYSSIYISWMAYGYFTALPTCLLGAVTLILIFRWIHVFVALLTVLMYFSVMMMLALMLAMFHNKAFIACVWSTLLTMLLTYLSELLVHHQWDLMHGSLTFVMHILLPPMGLIHAFNEFALLQTGRESVTGMGSESLIYMLMSWAIMILLYYGILMMLQRTIGHYRAIGGQVHWTTIIFKTIKDSNKLRPIEPPSLFNSSKVQEVDELVAKAVTFQDVSKTITGEQILNNVSFDIYRGEFTILFVERIQAPMMYTLEDLLTGLTFAEHGKINVLGERLLLGTEVMSAPYMMGYCHRAETLIDDLTVEEHLVLFTKICLWKYNSTNIFEYGQIRSKRLLNECDLEAVRYERVRDLHLYYKAQLCWALALLMEPRIIIIPHFLDEPMYQSVIKDKIMQYKKYVTIIKISYSSLELEFADRVFIFDNKMLVFGGTPAYMFFKYGREYRLRITLKSVQTNAYSKELLSRASQAGANVRAHLGTMLILRVPVSPTETVAALIQDLTNNSIKYGIHSFIVSVADSEEVSRRAIAETRKVSQDLTTQSDETAAVALQKLSEPRTWKRKNSWWHMHMQRIAWKFICFHRRHKIFFLITIIAAIIAGIFLGLSLVLVLKDIDDAKKILRAEVLSVEEALEQKTTLVVRTDNSSTSRSIANAYVLSDSNASTTAIENILYTALSDTESMTDYLVTRAIDSPQIYVYEYAYGMDVSHNQETGIIKVQALYSPLHHDYAAAPRSLSRVYMALLRHYTGQLNATIQVIDDPLFLDLSPWIKAMEQPPLFIQFLLILTISHITLLPSIEHGLIRHVQKHAMNFSPLKYWFSLYFCDLVMYWILVAIMTIAMLFVLFFSVPIMQIKYVDLMFIPIMLTVYGLGCIPQAYIFSLRPRVALNTMCYMMFNLVFGETTIVAKFFYGGSLTYALDFMSLSPQFNMACAYVKVKQIFLYNSECVIIESKNVCSVNTLHKCCSKCGVLQDCFVRKEYFNRSPGVLMEFIAMFLTAAVFMIILLLIEYRVFKHLWIHLTHKMATRDMPSRETLNAGVEREMEDVLDKDKDIQSRRRHKVNTFGEHLLVTNLAARSGGVYAVRNVYLGLSKGEALAISGLKQHGRLTLAKILGGYQMPTSGNCWAMSKWQLKSQPHQYSQQVSLCCERSSLPPWMSVHDALELIAALRGVPHKSARHELYNLLDALDLKYLRKTLICDLLPKDRTRVHFAAAVIGAPPVIVLDECTAHQKYSARRAMYSILVSLRKRGHAVYISSSSIEDPMPVTNRVAIIVDGYIYDLDTVDKFVERHSTKGYTVVVHLKDEVDVTSMFARHFQDFHINDTSEVLVNFQINDNLSFAQVFEKMEQLKTENHQVYSYVITVTSIDYVYNSIINNERGCNPSKGLISWKVLKKIISYKAKRNPPQDALDRLVPFERQYDVARLKVLPWSVIFHR